MFGSLEVCAVESSVLWLGFCCCSWERVAWEDAGKSPIFRISLVKGDFCGFLLAEVINEHGNERFNRF